MNKSLKISRKKFIKWIGLILLIPVSYLSDLVIKRKLEKESRNKKIIIPKDISEGLTILDSVIVNKSDNKLLVYSASCTHLGCKINNIESNQLICQCHGSRFDFNGTPVKGPAAKSLERLQINVDSKTGDYFVYA